MHLPMKTYVALYHKLKEFKIGHNKHMKAALRANFYDFSIQLTKVWVFFFKITIYLSNEWKYIFSPTLPSANNLFILGFFCYLQSEIESNQKPKMMQKFQKKKKKIKKDFIRDLDYEVENHPYRGAWLKISI